MKIAINLALQQDKVIALLEDNGYTFTEKKGIKLFFDTPEGLEAADKKAKELIKAEPWGTVLFFNVEVVA